MTTLREAAQHALEALKSCSGVPHWPALQPTIGALRAALTQQDEPVEPVAWSGYNLDGMVEAFSRVIEAHNSSKHPFHNPIDMDARMALRILRGFIPAMKAYAAPPQQAEPVEPVAWRTFDGEGGYDYRTYADNENYAAEWAQRNPRHVGWVKPLYTAPPRCPNCASLEAQNTELDRRLAELERAESAQEPVQEPVDVALLEYRGNSVAFIHQKMTAYRTGIDAAWDAFKAKGLHPDGKTSLADMIAKYTAPPQRQLQTIDEAMQQPRAMAQAYENGYKAGVATEREACAKVCEQYELARSAAAAIRARGEQP